MGTQISQMHLEHHEPRRCGARVQVPEPRIDAGESQMLRRHNELRRHAVKLRRHSVFDAVVLPLSKQSSEIPDLLHPKSKRSLQPKPPKPE